MSVYYCFVCDNLYDDDYHPMSDDGLCPDCEEDLLYEEYLFKVAQYKEATENDEE